jgi:hypothetical protein
LSNVPQLKVGGWEHGPTTQYCEPNRHNQATCNTTLRYIAGNQQFKNLHPKNYNKRT